MIRLLCCTLAFAAAATQADPFTLTACAWTEADTPGDNPPGSALTLAVGRLDDAAVVLPFAAFRQNGAAPVRWVLSQLLSADYSSNFTPWASGSAREWLTVLVARRM